MPLQTWDATPVKLASINYLEKSTIENISIEPLDTQNKIKKLHNNTYPYNIAKTLKLKHLLDRFTVNLINHKIPFYVIKRPTHQFMLDELVETLLETIMN